MTTFNQPNVATQPNNVPAQSAQPNAVQTFTMFTPNDALSQNMKPSAWTRGSTRIDFPIIEFTDSGSQRLVRHKYYGLRAAKTESTGRDPYVYNIQAVFINTIAPTPNGDLWKQGTLFPAIYNQMIQSLSDQSNPIGVFDHPYYGPISCKVVSWKTRWNNDFRGGAILDMVLEEVFDEDSDILSGVDPTTTISPNAVALQVDNQIVNPPTPAKSSNFPLGVIFAEVSQPGGASAIFAANALLGTVAPGVSLSFLAAGSNYFQTALGNLQQAIARPASLAGAAVQYATTLLQNLQQLKDLLDYQDDPNYGLFRSQVANLQFTTQNYLVKITSLQPVAAASSNTKSQKVTLLYVAQSPITLLHLSSLLSTSMDDLLTLNPQYSTTPVLKINDPVLYYQA